MNLRLPYLISGMMAVMVLSACEYEPEGRYEVEVNRITEVPYLYVDLNIETDTLYIPIKEATGIHFYTTDPLVRFSYFSLNGKQLALAGSSGTVYIEYNSTEYKPDLPYELVMEFYRSSGSGSLADKMFQEGFLYTRIFTVYFVAETSVFVRIKSVEKESSRLKVSWTRFEGIGFAKYHILADYMDGELVFTDQQRTWCYLDNYVGSGTRIWVVVEAENLVSGSPEFYLEPEFPKLTANYLGGLTMHLTWDKSKYPDNIAGYKLYESIDNRQYTNEIAFKTDPSDTIFITEDAPFGVNVRYVLEVIPKVQTSIHAEYKTETDVFYTGRTFPYMFNKSTSGSRFIYLNTSEGLRRLYKYDSELYQIIDTLPAKSYMNYPSPDGKWLLSSADSSFSLVETENFTVTANYTPDMFPGNQMPVIYRIGNSGIGVVISYAGNYFYDFNNRSIIIDFYRENIVDTDSWMRVSPDGTYFACFSFEALSGSTLFLYHYTGDNVVKVLQVNASFFDFDNQDNSFLYFSDGILSRLNLEDLSLMNTISMAQKYVFNIDWYRREILCINAEQDRISVIGLDDGEVKKTIKTQLTGEYNYLMLFNKTLWNADRIVELNY